MFPDHPSVYCDCDPTELFKGYSLTKYVLCILELQRETMEAGVKRLLILHSNIKDKDCLEYISHQYYK